MCTQEYSTQNHARNGTKFSHHPTPTTTPYINDAVTIGFPSPIARQPKQQSTPNFGISVVAISYIFEQMRQYLGETLIIEKIVH